MGFAMSGKEPLQYYTVYITTCAKSSRLLSEHLVKYVSAFKPME